MTQPDPIVAYTIRDLTTLACPLCTHTIDVPPVPVSDPVGQALGMSGATLAAVHAEQVAKRASTDMRAHLEGHDVVEWLAVAVPNGVAAARLVGNAVSEALTQADRRAGKVARR